MYSPRAAALRTLVLHKSVAAALTTIKSDLIPWQSWKKKNPTTLISAEPIYQHVSQCSTHS